MAQPALPSRFTAPANPNRPSRAFSTALWQHSVFLFEFQHSLFVFVLLSIKFKPPQLHVLMICSRIVSIFVFVYILFFPAIQTSRAAHCQLQLRLNSDEFFLTKVKLKTFSDPVQGQEGGGSWKQKLMGSKTFQAPCVQVKDYSDS